VDVGARWGAAASWFRLKPLARLVGFEPDPDECARLNRGADAHETFVPVALGREDGSATLHVTRTPACSSLYPPSAAMLDRYPSLRPWMSPDRVTTVPLARLASWAATAGVDRVDFIKLDTQGAELDILRGAGGLLDGCLGVEAEVMFSPLYDGQPLFADVDAFLRSRGFTLWRLDSLSHYTDRPSDVLAHTATTHYEHVPVHHPAGDGRLVWANAIYFRDRDQVRGSVRSLLGLAALLEAAGDADGADGCLRLLPAAGQGSAAAPPSRESPRPSDEEARAYLDGIGAIDDGDRRRIRMTLGCGDCDAIPKVPGAGEVFAAGRSRYQLMHNGVKVVEDGYCGRWMTELIRLLRGHHEPQEERAFHEVVRRLTPGAVMVELGSYWAYYSLWFLREVVGGRVVLVEPDPNHLAVGRANFGLNGVAGEFHQASVGRCPLPPQPFVCESDGRSRDLPELSVDDLAERSGLPRIDLLLADIQGAELAMLEGAVRTIARGGLRFAFVSTHHHRISGDPLTHQRCLRFIRDHGGHVLAEHSVSESYSGDGLIVASFDPADRDLAEIPLARNRASGSLFGEPEADLARAWDAAGDAVRALERWADRAPELRADLDALGARLRELGVR
jgi:FkbM family methyltransferase